jgi:hypothetical protein
MRHPGAVGSKGERRTRRHGRLFVFGSAAATLMLSACGGGSGSRLGAHAASAPAGLWIAQGYVRASRNMTDQGAGTRFQRRWYFAADCSTRPCTVSFSRQTSFGAERTLLAPHGSSWTATFRAREPCATGSGTTTLISEFQIHAAPGGNALLADEHEYTSGGGAGCGQAGEDTSYRAEPVAGVRTLAAAALAPLSDGGSMLTTPWFQTSVPVGWKVTRTEHGGQTTIAVSEAGAPLDASGIPTGVGAGVTIGVIPDAVLAHQRPPIAARGLSPRKLLLAVVGTPTGTAPHLVQAPGDAAIDGSPAADLMLGYRYRGQSNLQYDAVTERGGYTFVIEMDAPPAWNVDGREAVSSISSHWSWTAPAPAA